VYEDHRRSSFLTPDQLRAGDPVRVISEGNSEPVRALPAIPWPVEVGGRMEAFLVEPSTGGSLQYSVKAEEVHRTQLGSPSSNVAHFQQT